MSIRIMGTGNVAQALAEGWTKAGHSVTLGSRDPGSRTGLPSPVAGLTETAQNAEAVVNATLGSSSKDLLARVGAGTLVDVANAVTPSFELVYPNSSLGEELQEAFPDARVVKTLNTCNTSVQTNPSVVPPSSVFLSGDEEAARTEAAGLLQDLGWSEGSIVDLGGLSTAKGPEHYFLVFATILQALGTPTFNIHLIH